jgi:hypothetical protein
MAVSPREPVFRARELSKVYRMGEVEVLDGLREGESVIAHPSNLVADGVRVSVDKNDRKVH